MSRFSIDADIAKAATLSADFYTDAQLFELAKEKLFAPSWQFIGDSDGLAVDGECRPLILLDGYLDEPLVLVRDQEQELHLLSNVCTHRGNLVVQEPCRLAHLRCRYHGRQFDLDGGFRSMPEFREVENFPSAADNLRQLPLGSWGKWLFASLTGDGQVSQTGKGSRGSSDGGLHGSADGGFRSYWGDLMRRLPWLPLNDYVFQADLSRDFTVKAHWALYVENYLEGFHIPYVHAGLNAVIDFGNYTTELFRYSILQLGIGKAGEEVFDLPASSPDHGKNVAAYYFFIFPNTMFNFYPWGLSVNIVQPVSPGETRISFLTYIADEEKYGKGAGSGLDIVEFEDEAVVEAVQKGVRSRFYTHGRYSVTREQGTHHFHRLIAEGIG